MIRELPGARLARRALNLGRRAVAGLTLFGENVSPEVPNDLFVAHLSIYHFAARFARGARVLDLGCGAGYGSVYLHSAGAAIVLGLDLDPRNIRYAKRHSRSVQFRQADAEHLPPNLGTFDLIVASNVLEHVHEVTRVLDRLQDLLAPGGRLVVAVPPIQDELSLRANEAIPYHRSNFYVSRWTEMLAARFGGVTSYRHSWREGVMPDFEDPFRSRLTPDDFLFEEGDLMAQPTLTALFVAGKSSGAQRGSVEP